MAVGRNKKLTLSALIVGSGVSNQVLACFSDTIVIKSFTVSNSFC